MGSVSGARSRLMMARESLEKRQWDDLERYLGAAAPYLEGLTVQESAPIRAQIAPAQRTEKSEKVEREVKRAITTVEDEIARRGSQVEQYLNKAVERIGAADVREYLAAEAIDRWQGQLAELQAKAGVGQPVKRVAPEVARASTPAAPASAPPSAPAQIDRAPAAAPVGPSRDLEQ